MALSSFRACLVFGLASLAACQGPVDPSERSSAFVANAGNDAILVEGGKTQPIYGYADAVRESVWVEAAMDSDGDGHPDRIALDIVRPKTAPGAKIAVVMEASPYYRPSSLAPQDALAPLGHYNWNSRYFVERGYASIEVEMQGTGRSTGCPKSGGREDTASVVAAIDWLNGRARAFYADGAPAVASWSTGSVGMVGVSYNGTLPIAVAAENVDGLKTIVPIAAISSWYDYARDYGIGYPRRWDKRYPEWLATFVSSRAAATACRDSTARLGDEAGDDTFDVTAFWDERDYRQKMDRITASVFVVHGLRDTNVKLRHFGRLWDGLSARNVPRRLWLHNDGHTDPISVRPVEWTAAIHQWMDRWLYGVANGAENEPLATIQRGDGSWETHASWPEARGVEVSLHPTVAKTLESTPATRDPVQTLIDDPTKTEDELVARPDLAMPYRLAWASAPLDRPVRVSGTPRARVAASADTESTPFSVVLVDYGKTTVWRPENLSVRELMEPTCTLSDIERTLNGCARARPRVFESVLYQIVSSGSVDVKNRLSLREPTPLRAGETYEVEWELQPVDHVFPSGHQIGLVVSANNSTYASVDARAHQLSVHLDRTRVVLPVAPPVR